MGSHGSGMISNTRFGGVQPVKISSEAALMTI